VVVEGTAEQTGPYGVAEDAPFFSLKFKIGIVGAEVHRLPAAVEFKRPRAGLNAGFKLELAR